MRRLPLIFAALAALSASAQPSAPDATAYVGGLWYDGSGFAARDTVWAEGGAFVAGPLEVARVVDLSGRYVVPPYGDAHYHGLDRLDGLAADDSAFVAAGLFYVLNPNNRRSWRDEVRGVETVVDVAYANGGVTAPGAHPVPGYEAKALGLQIADLWGPRADEIRASRLLDGDAYHLALTVRDLDAVWPDVLAGRPDWIKVYLLGSEEWAEGTPGRPGGLSPAVAAETVRRARAAGLPVAAHVETAADARAALDAGVDLLAHAPGYAVNDRDPAATDGPHRMDDALLAGLAVAGLPVTPTLARGPAMVRFIPEPYRPDSATVEAVRRYHGALYRRLADAGVPIAFGADSYGMTAADEAAYAVETGGLAPAEALRALSVTTPRAVFPRRRIGRLAPGHEASLLALACDPTADWSCTGRIEHREKQGVPFGPAASAD